MQNETNSNKNFEILEAVLFAAGHPVTYEKLGEILEISADEALKLVEEYSALYNSDTQPRGVQLILFDKA